MTPVVKWVGGKRRLVNTLTSMMPPKYNKLHELFCGGAALFFHLEQPNAVIADMNWHLINFYKAVRDTPEELLALSNQHENNKEYYNEIRAWEDISKSDIELAARFLYLNKTAYSGMWRVNKRNRMNVPFANYPDKNYADPTQKYIKHDTLMSASALLKDTTIHHGSYDSIIPGRHDFVYLDPPYDQTWTGYTNEVFSQQGLKDYCDRLNDIGAYFMVSNSATDFIKELYVGYEIFEIDSAQAISGRHDKAGTRDKVKEVIITNY